MSNNLIAIPSGGTLTESQALGILIEHSVKQQRQLDAVSLEIKMMHEDIEAMRETVQQLEKITPAQATALGQLVRDRAAAVASEWGLPESQISRITTEIRRALRVAYGITSYRYLPRCLYETAAHRVALWEEFDILEGLRRE